jgi:hypothetical protein
MLRIGCAPLPATSAADKAIEIAKALIKEPAGKPASPAREPTCSSELL